MTNNDQHNHPDPRLGLAVALQLATSVAEGVDIAQAGRPTPSGEFTVESLMGHLVCVVRRITLIAKREDSTVVPLVVDDVDLADIGAELLDEADQAIEAWSDDALMGEMLTLPFARVPGSVAAGLYTGELLTHSWDLAVSTGQTVEWPDELIEGVLVGAKMGIPADPRGDEIPFGEVVEVPDDSPAIERLVAWVGRDPADWK